LDVPLVALDATYSTGRNLSGVGVYSSEILHALASAHQDARFLWYYRPHRFLRSLGERLPPNCSRRLLYEPTAPRRAGLFHGLNQRLPQTRLPRTVCTFHDLFVLTGEYSTPEFRRRFELLARDAAQRSDLIIAVSSFTAGQVESLLGVERSRLRVVHHGVHPPATIDHSSRERIILTVGAIQERKNVARLVRAFERTEPGWRLVLAGSSGYGAERILAAIDASPRRKDIEIRGYVSRGQLEGLYRRASIFAFPSLDEGFGIPVLEAMAWGIPVITSNRSALPEVSGDAAILVEPEDEDSIASALNVLTGDTGLRRELSYRGRLRAGTFSWEKAALKTWTVYRELA
jgi:glycosyltransferase involved in cell wall biosynthesis